MKICDWCSGEFQPNVAYQIYCCAECREAATKEKTVEKNKIKKRNKLSKKKRKCSSGCGTLLSIYNSSGVCSSCSVGAKQIDKAMKELKGIIDYERFD